jgi:hypothetical protein
MKLAVAKSIKEFFDERFGRFWFLALSSGGIH